MRARRAEARVLDHFLARGCALLYHGKKIFGVEVDMILVDGDCNIIFVEVKIVGHPGFAPHRLSGAQRRRLSHAKMFFESAFGLPVEVRLALVERVGNAVGDFAIL